MKSLLNSAGKGNRPVAAVFGSNPTACHQAISYLRQQQPEIPIWLFSTAQPAFDTAALCERVEVRANAATLLLQAQIALWPRWVVLSAGTWTGESGNWLLKLAPFLIPPFRTLLLNGNGDFMSGRFENVLIHWWRECVKARCNQARDIVRAVSLLAIATVLQWLRNPHRALFHRLHGVERLRIPYFEDGTNTSVVRYEWSATHWQGEPIRALLETSGARWILWGGGLPTGASIDDMLRLFDDDRTFAVSVQSHARGWKRGLLPASPFRTLQPGEATQLLAPLPETILVSRKKLAALGVPDCGLAATAWLFLFWKAAAAGWRSYAIGRNGPVSAEPEFPVQETAFALRVLSNNASRRLGPCEPELSRGNIAFNRAPSAFSGQKSGRLRILVASPFLPYPLSHGGAVRIFNLCRALSDRVDFGLVAIREAGDVVDYAKLHDVFRDVWIVDLDEPESNNMELPGQVRHYSSRTLRALVAGLCRNWKPDLLQVEYTHLAALQENAGGVPAILVEHDLTLGLYRQMADYEPGESAEWEYRRWLNFERRWLHAYDGVWTVSAGERRKAIRHGTRRGDRTFTIPNGVDPLRFQPSEASISRLEVLYVGSFRHWPNILGFDKLRTEIMPRIWAKFPAAVLRVVAGPDPERFYRMLRPAVPWPSDERVEVLGFVEDLRPLYARAAAVVVPLAISSGTNIKVLEAASCGKAIVSTPIGCAGLSLRDGYDIFIREDWGEFARTVCELVSGQSLRSQLGRNARRAVEERFSWEAIGQRAFRSYLTVLGRAPRIRAQAYRKIRDKECERSL